MPQPSYAYAVARIRALETKLLTTERINRMVEAATAEEAYKLLGETHYGTAMADYASYYDYDALLSEEMEAVVGTVNQVTPDQQLTDLFLIKYDIHNIKVIMKSRALRTASEDLLIQGGTLPIEMLKESIENIDLNRLPDWLRAGMRELIEGLSVKFDPMLIESILDQTMFQRIFTVLSEKKHPILHAYFTKQVDYINLKSLLRVKLIHLDDLYLKRVLIPFGTIKPSFYMQAINESVEQLIERIQYSSMGNVVDGLKAFLETGRLSSIEKQIDDYLLSYMVQNSRQPFDIEAVVAYLLSKENEIKIIRLIMVAHINGLSVEKLRERLRNIYV